AAFEAAERLGQGADAAPERIQALLTFVVVGAGPTGVELAGALSEIARGTLRGEFRHINPAQARIVLVEGMDRVLTHFAPNLTPKVERALRRLGVDLRLQSRVTDVRPGQVVVQRGDESEIIPAHTVLWAAGVQASPLGQALHKATGVETDRVGRVKTQAD